MSFLSILNPNKLMENVSKGIDKAILTDEERADMFPKLLSMYEPFKVAQRWLMIIVCFPYMLAWFITLCAAFFMEVDQQMEMLSGPILYVVGTIAGFYFGGGMVEGIVGKIKKLKPSK